MRPLWKLTVTELKLFLREPAAVFFTLAFPLLLLWLNGSSGNRPRAELGGRGVMDVLAPGFVAMVLAEVGLTSLPGLLSSYRERGILRRLAVTPVSPARLLAAQPLTQRELQVLELVARGATNREVASRLQVSEATVTTHLVHAFGKLGVSDRTAAVTAALERRLIRLDG